MKLERLFVMTALLVLPLVGCQPPEGSVPAKSLSAGPAPSVSLPEGAGAHGGRLVAYRMTYQLYQKVKGEHYMDVTVSSYLANLAAQRNQKQPITAQRIYYLWGPASKVVDVLAEASAV